jgi:hypothetical protein
VIRKRPRTGVTPQEEGRRFERFWSALFGVKPTRGSGNLWWAKLDVGDTTFLFSCKNTIHASFSLTKALMREVEEAIKGGDAIPAIATAIENHEVFVTLRAEDFLRLIQSDKAKYIVPSKGEQKRARGKIPALLRDEGETR